jgi:hypothetical protein
MPLLYVTKQKGNSECLESVNRSRIEIPTQQFMMPLRIFNKTYKILVLE